MTDKSLDELREATEKSDRVHEEASQGSFGERVKTALDDVDSGPKSESVSTYDKPLAAILHAMDAEDGALEEDVAALQEALGKRVDAEDAKRAHLVSLSVRYALQELDPERFEEANSAYAEWSDTGL